MTQPIKSVHLLYLCFFLSIKKFKNKKKKNFALMIVVLTPSVKKGNVKKIQLLVARVGQ